MEEKADIIAEVCGALLALGPTAAAKTLQEKYAPPPPPPPRRRADPARALRIFQRDGFIDRYTGQRLVFPGVLRVLSRAMPRGFPFHPNWRIAATHPAYWELSPTLDHVVPVARGGADDESNLVTTSMLRNSAKANWTLEELGWKLHPGGRLEDWDGLTGWFRKYVGTHEDCLHDRAIARWYRLVIRNATRR